MFIIKLSVHNSLYNCMQLKLGSFLIKIRNLPNKRMMCKICKQNVSCRKGDMINVHACAEAG